MSIGVHLPQREKAIAPACFFKSWTLWKAIFEHISLTVPTVFNFSSTFRMKWRRFLFETLVYYLRAFWSLALLFFLFSFFCSKNKELPFDQGEGRLGRGDLNRFSQGEERAVWNKLVIFVFLGGGVVFHVYCDVFVTFFFADFGDRDCLFLRWFFVFFVL